MTRQFDDGEIVEYEYLWEWQAQKGRTNAEKGRPVCLPMVVRDTKQGITHLIILPISSTQPRPDQDALAIPALELRRAGLAAFKAGWITVSEYNYDVLERSFYFNPDQKPRGRFSGPFMDQILIRFRRYLKEKRGRIDRTR